MIPIRLIRKIYKAERMRSSIVQALFLITLICICRSKSIPMLSGGIFYQKLMKNNLLPAWPEGQALALLAKMHRIGKKLNFNLVQIEILA